MTSSTRADVATLLADVDVMLQRLGVSPPRSEQPQPSPPSSSAHREPQRQTSPLHSPGTGAGRAGGCTVPIACGHNSASGSGSSGPLSREAARREEHHHHQQQQHQTPSSPLGVVVDPLLFEPSSPASPRRRARALQLWQITIPHDASSNIFSAYAVLLSFVPWLMFVAMHVVLVLEPCRQTISFVLFKWCAVRVNERHVKPFIQQPRPPESGLTTSGMPSSHALLSIGSTTVLLRFALFEAQPVLPLHAVGPLVTAFLLPVPWARVRCGDHTVAQVTAGSLVGVLCATIHTVLEAVVVAALAAAAHVTAIPALPPLSSVALTSPVAALCSVLLLLCLCFALELVCCAARPRRAASPTSVPAPSVGS